jgi:hypothetical protein
MYLMEFSGMSFGSINSLAADLANVARHRPTARAVRAANVGHAVPQ